MTSQFSGPQQQGLDSITLEAGLMLVIKVFGFWFLGSGMPGSGFFLGLGLGLGLFLVLLSDYCRHLSLR